jgi:23S rRNA (guanine745-N1)-methyltransferase
VLDEVSARLRCPNCAAALTLAGGALRCAHGHAFDLARQGYVTLAPPRSKLARGDSPEMVAAREAFLGAGHFEPLARSIALAARAAFGPASFDQPADSAALARRAPLAVDLGAGTGYHLAALLRDRPGWLGVALDASRPALRKAVRADPHIAAIACDVWQQLPIQDASAELVLDVFAPRNGPEIARVLSPGGALIVVTPAPDHLRALVEQLGLLDIDVDKQQRVHATLAPHLEPVQRDTLAFEMALDRADVRALVTMGPSAHHIDARELDERLARAPDQCRVAASLVIETFRRRSRIAPAR